MKFCHLQQCGRLGGEKMLSDISQTEKDKRYIKHLYVESKKIQFKQVNTAKRNQTHR